MVDGLVGTITFNVFHLLNSTHICQVILFLVVFTLGNTRVHVGNEASDIKPPIDEAFHLHFILYILYVNPNNVSRLKVVDLTYFYFIFIYFSIFLFLELRVRASVTFMVT